MTAETWTIVLVSIATLVAWRRWKLGDQQSPLFREAAARMSQQAADEIVRSVARKSVARWAVLALLALGGGVFAPQGADLAAGFVAGVSERVAGLDGSGLEAVPVPRFEWEYDYYVIVDWDHVAGYDDQEEALEYGAELVEQGVRDGDPPLVLVCTDPEGDEYCWGFEVRR